MHRPSAAGFAVVGIETTATQYSGQLRLNSRSESEDALLDSHAKLIQNEVLRRSLFENSATGVALADLSGGFIAAPAHEKMLVTRKRN